MRAIHALFLLISTNGFLLFSKYQFKDLDLSNFYFFVLDFIF